MRNLKISLLGFWLIAIMLLGACGDTPEKPDYPAWNFSVGIQGFHWDARNAVVILGEDWLLFHTAKNFQKSYEDLLQIGLAGDGVNNRILKPVALSNSSIVNHTPQASIILRGDYGLSRIQWTDESTSNFVLEITSVNSVEGVNYISGRFEFGPCNYSYGSPCFHLTGNFNNIPILEDYKDFNDVRFAFFDQPPPTL